MATGLNESYRQHIKNLDEMKKQYPGISEDILKTMAVEALPTDLKIDKYTKLSHFDGDRVYFLLRHEMNTLALFSRLKEMKFEITQPNKEEKVVLARKGNFLVGFDVEGASPYLVTSVIHSDERLQPELKSFLKELYREHPEE